MRLELGGLDRVYPQLYRTALLFFSLRDVFFTAKS